MSLKKTSSCHLCFDQRVPTKERVICSVKRCSQMYCLTCVKSVFDENFDITSYKEDCWVCYSCAKMCSCNRCKGVLPSRKKNCQKTQISKQKITQEQHKPTIVIPTVLKNVPYKLIQEEVVVKEEESIHIKPTFYEPEQKPTQENQTAKSQINPYFHFFHNFYASMYQPFPGSSYFFNMP